MSTSRRGPGASGDRNRGAFRPDVVLAVLAAAALVALVLALVFVARLLATIF